MSEYRNVGIVTPVYIVLEHATWVHSYRVLSPSGRHVWMYAEMLMSFDIAGHVDWSQFRFTS